MPPGSPNFPFLLPCKMKYSYCLEYVSAYVIYAKAVLFCFYIRSLLVPLTRSFQTPELFPHQYFAFHILFNIKTWHSIIPGRIIADMDHPRDLKRYLQDVRKVHSTNLDASSLSLIGIASDLQSIVIHRQEG